MIVRFLRYCACRSRRSCSPAQERTAGTRRRTERRRDCTRWLMLGTGRRRREGKGGRGRCGRRGDQEFYSWRGRMPADFSRTKQRKNRTRRTASNALARSADRQNDRMFPSSDSGGSQISPSAFSLGLTTHLLLLPREFAKEKSQYIPGLHSETEPNCMQIDHHQARLDSLTSSTEPSFRVHRFRHLRVAPRGRPNQDLEDVLQVCPSPCQGTRRGPGDVVCSKPGTESGRAQEHPGRTNSGRWSRNNQVSKLLSMEPPMGSQPPSAQRFASKAPNVHLRKFTKLLRAELCPSVID